MSRRIALVAVALAACTSQAAGPPQGRAAGQPSFDETPVPETPTTPAPVPTTTATPGGGASSCDGARLALAPDAVVGRVDGKDIRASELGPELEKAETTALRAYCEAVANVRKQALENTVQMRLLAAASGSADGNAWLRTEVDKLVEPPTDEDISA
ncbi:MAG: hypothetical protein IAG13_21205, partial [Deltaproteobacteria bacterium]|nr:hypothetical protein [Nannocystaceae bacterium]